jgi:hypothetical protein
MLRNKKDIEICKEGEDCNEPIFIRDIDSNSTTPIKAKIKRKMTNCIKCFICLENRFCMTSTLMRAFVFKASPLAKLTIKIKKILDASSVQWGVLGNKKRDATWTITTRTIKLAHTITQISRNLSTIFRSVSISTFILQAQFADITFFVRDSGYL